MFGNPILSLDDIRRKSVYFLEEFNMAQHFKPPSRRILIPSVRQENWLPPPMGSVKMNVASCKPRGGMGVGYGAIMRGSSGEISAAMAGVLEGDWSQPLADMLVVRKCLVWFRSLGFSRVILEVGSKQVLASLSGRDSDWTLELIGIVHDCLDLGKDLRLQILFSTRSINRVARELACLHSVVGDEVS